LKTADNPVLSISSPFLHGLFVFELMITVKLFIPQRKVGFRDDPLTFDDTPFIESAFHRGKLLGPLRPGNFC